MKENKGYLYATTAYFLWGILPIYWKQVDHIPAVEVLLHRILWSLVFLAALLSLQRNWGWLRTALRNRKILLIYTAATLFLSLNWGIYIWAVNASHIVETSLGYFINPLVSVFFGMIFLGERLRPVQWLAILIAGSGVLFLFLSGGDLVLWIALALPLTFAVYALLKKKAPLDSLKGLTLETAIVGFPALLILLYWGVTGQGALGQVDRSTDFFLVASGAATAIPLLFFGAAAPRIPMRMIGILQYVAPTMQFLLGVFVYGEPFDQTRFIGFCIIWVALIIYTVESFLNRQRTTLRAA
ncbi:MAG: EamA family transporter RarD [Ardenticatenaceae bacterium]|nr:EamA family transporter RarD [Ardenticatenaceae bacterium]